MPSSPKSGLPAQLLAYLESLRITQGREAGEYFAVLPWQRKFLRGAFRPDVRTAALSVARGNGKTTLLGGIAAAAVDGPLAQARGETVIVASSFSQALILFEHSQAFLGPAMDESRRDFRVLHNAATAAIEYKPTGARLRCLGSDPNRLHGIAPSLVLCDEPAQWPPGQRDRMLGALMTSLGKQPAGRLIALGTRPAGADHWFERMLRPGGPGAADYAQVHAAGAEDHPHVRRTWGKANPSLAAMPDLAEAIRRESEVAKDDVAALAAFKALRLNAGTLDYHAAVLLESAAWQACETDAAARAGPVIWGCDLGTSHAMSAVAAYWPETGRLEAFAAFPELPDLAARGRTDHVGDLYQRMAARGELATAGKRSVDIPMLLKMALDRYGRPAAVVADRWREAELRDALDQARVPMAAMIPRGMGFRDGSEDVRGFRRAVADRRIAAPPSLLLRSAIAEARVLTDPAGNSKLAKSAEGGRRQLAKDDAAAAAILAVAYAERARPAARPALRVMIA